MTLVQCSFDINVIKFLGEHRTLFLCVRGIKLIKPKSKNWNFTLSISMDNTNVVLGCVQQ